MRSRKSPENKSEIKELAAHLIRLPVDDIEVLEVLGQSAAYSTVNRFSAEIIVAALEVCEHAIIPTFLLKMRTYKTHRLLWAQLAERDIRRSLPYAQTRPIKITIPPDERERIANLSRDLRWSSSQVIIEALQAYCVLAGADKPLSNLPDLIRMARANQSYKTLGSSESAAYLFSKFNLELGLDRRPPPIHAPDDTPPQGLDTDLELI